MGLLAGPSSNPDGTTTFMALEGATLAEGAALALPVPATGVRLSPPPRILPPPPPPPVGRGMVLLIAR